MEFLISPQEPDPSGTYGFGPTVGASQESALGGNPPAQQVAPYIDYEVTFDWEYQSGLEVLIPANDDSGLDQPASILPVEAANVVVYTRFKMTRLGFPCDLPPTTPPAGLVLLYAKVKNFLPSPSVEATSALFRVQGEYKYVALVPGTAPLSPTLVGIPQYGA